MKKNKNKGVNHSKIAAVTMGGPIALIFLAMAIKLFLEGRYNPGTGFSIAFVLMLFCITIVFINPSALSANRIAGVIMRQKPQEIVNFKVVFTSKDPVEISHIKEVLKYHGINSFIFNENASGMMKFLQDVQITILVHKDDYDKSMVIVNEIMEWVEKEEKT